MPTTLAEAMARVMVTAERHGLAAFAREAGVPEATVRLYWRRGWPKSVTICDALIAAANRLENGEPQFKGAAHARAGD
jgi:hypothetical protein